MKATELRIGNWAMLHDEECMEHGEFHLKQVDGHHLSNPFMFPDFGKPIEINTEWLEKFGFTKQTGMSGNLFYSLNDFQWDKSLGMALDDEYLSLDHIKYVHQLQNLHMALTGQELTIKMPV